MVKIAFNIARQNWYRVLAAPINESLRRGWAVTCLHGNEEHRPQEDFPLPPFSTVCDKNPCVQKYKGATELANLLKDCDFDVVVDADLIPKPLTELLENNRTIPLKVLLDGITHPRLQMGVKLPKYDLFFVPSQWHIDSTVGIMTRDHSVVLSDAEIKLGAQSKKVFADWNAMYINRWSEEDVQHYRSNSVIIGTPSLDDVQRIDRSMVRRRWGISLDTPIVGLLPSPWDMPMGYFWGDMNMVQNYFDLLRVGMAYGLMKKLKSLNRIPKDRDIVQAISRFCNRNGAWLVAKLRKKRKAKKYLIEHADLIVGEDSFFPHTSLELFAIADVVFGFCTTGAFECIATGTPYVDINIPFFPKKEVIQLSSPSTEVTLPWEGAIYEMSAQSAINELPNMGIDKFRLDHKAQIDYLDYFTAGVDGGRSAMMLNAIELRLKQT